MTDPDVDDGHTWTLARGPDEMTVDDATGALAWTPTRADVGSHDVVIEVADDGGLVDRQAFTLSVDETNEPPSAACPETLPAFAGLPFGHRLRATDPNGGDTFAFALEQGPTDLTLSADGVLRWTPSDADAGDHTVSLVVVDDAGAEAGCALVIHVTAEDDADADFDGFRVADGDCDDEDPGVHPGALDIAGDGIDQDCLGGDASVSVAAYGLAEHRTVVVGETALFDHVVHVDGETSSATVSHRVAPDDGGLLLTAATAPPGSFDGGRTAALALTIEAVAPGNYEVVTTVEDTGTGITGEAVTPIVVVGGPVRARVSAPVFEPGAVLADTRGQMTLTVRVEEADAQLAGVLVEEIGDEDDVSTEPLWLVDDGSGLDLAPGDGVFTGLLSYDYPEEGALPFRAVPVLLDGSRGPEALRPLPVTRFPVGSPTGEIGRTVFHPDSGAEIVADRLIVQFGADVSSDAIEAVAAAQGAEVIGYLPGFELHVLQVPEAVDGETLLAQREALFGETGVVDVEPSVLISPAGVDPSDPPWDQQQDWAQAIKLPEAWLFGPSGVVAHLQPALGRVPPPARQPRLARDPIHRRGHVDWQLPRRGVRAPHGTRNAVDAAAACKLAGSNRTDRQQP